MNIRGKLYNKIISGLVLCFILINIVYSPTYAATNSSSDGVQRVTNSFTQYSVNRENGRFSIKTDEGVPFRNDEQSNLTFEEDKPETSFTTFRINGNDYIYGNSYGFLNMKGTFTQAPTTIGKKITSTWLVDNIYIKQTLELLEDEKNPNVGNVKITYEVTNKGSSNAEIGARVLLDTMLGSNDGVAITLGGSIEPITHEEKITGGDVPQYWRSTDSLVAPRVISYGFNSGWGNISPDEMIIAHWSNISETKWHYEVDASLDFTSTTNKYNTKDSAVALYWNPITIQPDKTQVFETFYGIGNFQNYYEGAKFKVNVNGPDKLTLNSTNTGYTDDTFEIIAEVDNTLAGATSLTNVTASLILEDGLEIVEEQIPYDETSIIKANEIHTFKWTVRANNQTKYTAKQFRVDINCDNNTEPISGTGYILIPGVNGEPPAIQFQSVSPDKLYYQGAKSFSIKGKGFDVYKDKSKWNMYLINEATNESSQIALDEIMVNSDVIQVNMNKDFDKGNYSIKIDHNEFGTEAIPHRITMTDDKRYKCRTYGVLYIKKYQENGEWKYSIETTESMEKLQELKQSYENNDSIDIILDLKGEIRQYNTDGKLTYKIVTDSESLVFNSVLHYNGTPLEISKVGDTIQFVGDGKLTVENGFSFWWWDFEISIKDGENYIKEYAEEDGDDNNIEIILTGIGRVLKTISCFNIEIENALILENGVSFGGSMELSFLPDQGEAKPSINDMEEMDENEVDGEALRMLFGEDKDDEDDILDKANESSISNSDGEKEEDEEDEVEFSVEISKILFGKDNNSNEVGFIGIDSVTSFEAPEKTIPIPLIKDGFEATLTINTIEDVYGLEGEIDIKICEAYVNLTFMKDQRTQRYLPDDIVLAAGFDPGYPIGTTGAFVTKIGGGVEDLFGTITGDNSLPPLQIVLIGGLKFAGVIDAELTIKASKEGFTLDGEGEIAKIKCLESLHVGLRWAKPISFELSAELSLFDIVEGEISLYIGEDKWEGKVGASIQIPKPVKFIGGLKIAAVEMGANNDKIWGNVELIGIPVGVTYYWGRGVDFDLWACADNTMRLENKGISRTNIVDEDGNEITMVVGSNIRKIGSSNMAVASISPYLDDIGVIASIDNKDHLFNIVDQDKALLELKFTGQLPNLTVYRPDGSEYTLVTQQEDSINANVIVQEIQPEDSQSGELEQYVYISITNPQDGQWRVVSDVEIESTLMDVEPVPEISNINVTQLENSKLEVAWSSTNSDGAIVNIFLARDLEQAGILIGSDINPVDGTATVDVPLDTETGDYYIRVAIQKDDFGYDSTYSSSTIHIIDHNKPDAVEGIQANNNGDGMLYAKWQPSLDVNVEGYYISVYDDAGNIIEDLGHQYVSKDKSEMILGGQYKPSDSDEIVGLATGKRYKVGIVASKKIGTEENYTYHYSDIAFSQLVYLPAPNPAQIDIQYDGSFIDGYNDEGQPSKISNAEEVTLYFNSNQTDIMTEVYVNGVLFKRKAGQSFEVTLPSADGNYNVQFKTVNNNGDVSSETVSYTIDKIAPMLLVDSPVQGQMSQNGYVLVKGISEKGVLVTVNGTSVTIDENGGFEAQIKLENKLNQEVVIEAIDKANNISTYSTEVVNDTVKSIKQVYIKPQTQEITANETITFELNGIDEEGKEVKLDNSNVEWSLMTGANLATVSDNGVVTAYSTGEIILKASYSITDDYTFEDAMSIEIVPPVDNEDTSNNHDRHNNDSEDSDNEENTEEELEAERINKELEDILNRIIMSEENLTEISTWDIEPNSSQLIKITESFSIDIPEEAILDRDELLVAKVDKTEEYLGDNNDTKFVSDIYELQFAKSNNNLKGSVGLKFKYDKTMVNDYKNIAVYYYNEKFGKWQYIGGTINLQTREVSAEINHFSKYALMEVKEKEKFEDIQDRWSENYIIGLASLEVINGIKRDGVYYYEPSRKISRLEFAKLVVATLENIGEIEELEYADEEIPFSDWENIADWGKRYAMFAYKNNIINGRDTLKGKMFAPLDFITREEAATILGRTLDLDIYINSEFADKTQISSWAKEYIDKLVQKGIIGGYSDNTFKPKANLTREEAAKMIYNWIENVLRLQ